MNRFFLPLLVFPICAFAEGGLPDKPYIYVEGVAETEKPADIVSISFDVVARAPDQPKANADVQAKANNVFALLKAHNVEEKNISAESLQSSPEFEHQDTYGGSGKVTGYKVTRPFQVWFWDIDAYPKLIDELIAIGGIEFSGIEGTVAKKKEVQEQLWDKALSDARAKAEKTLKPMGMKIDSVFAISPVPFLAVQGKIFTEEGLPYSKKHNIPTAEEVGPPQYKVAPVTLSQEVHVIYLISPAK